MDRDKPLEGKDPGYFSDPLLYLVLARHLVNFNHCLMMTVALFSEWISEHLPNVLLLQGLRY